MSKIPSAVREIDSSPRRDEATVAEFRLRGLNFRFSVGKEREGPLRSQASLDRVEESKILCDRRERPLDPSGLVVSGRASAAGCRGAIGEDTPGARAHN